MACFLAPAAEAIALTIVKHQVKKKEEIALPKNAEGQLEEKAESSDGKIPFSRKLSWLTNLLWGGSFLLLFEHIWHGEIVPYPPFLTAMLSKADTLEMLKEIATAGVTMAVLCTVVWCGMLAVSHIMEKRRAKAAVEA